MRARHVCADLMAMLLPWGVSAQSVPLTEVAARLRDLVAILERRAAAERHRSATSGNADRLERIAEVSCEAGERGILELFDAHRSTTAVRLQQSALDAAVREAQIELEFASGWEIP